MGILQTGDNKKDIACSVERSWRMGKYTACGREAKEVVELSSLLNWQKVPMEVADALEGAKKAAVQRILCTP